MLDGFILIIMTALSVLWIFLSLRLEMDQNQELDNIQLCQIYSTYEWSDINQNINYSLTLVLIGWGKDFRKGDDLRLTQIDVAVRSQAYCNYVLNKTKHEGNRRVFLQIETFLPELLKESQFCADKTILTDEEKITKGDSGGPSVRR